METLITPRLQIQTRKPAITTPNTFARLQNRYRAYIQEQDNYKVLWYMKVVLIIPCAYMVLSTFAMAELIDKFEYWIGFTTLVFFANILIHVIQLRSKVYVPAYHISLGLFIGIPAITYIITQIL